MRSSRNNSTDAYLCALDLLRMCATRVYTVHSHDTAVLPFHVPVIPSFFFPFFSFFFFLLSLAPTDDKKSRGSCDLVRDRVSNLAHLAISAIFFMGKWLNALDNI